MSAHHRSRIGTVHDPLTARIPRTMREAAADPMGWIEHYRRPGVSPDWIVAGACVIGLVLLGIMALAGWLPGASN